MLVEVQKRIRTFNVQRAHKTIQTNKLTWLHNWHKNDISTIIITYMYKYNNVCGECIYKTKQRKKKTGEKKNMHHTNELLSCIAHIRRTKP